MFERATGCPPPAQGRGVREGAAPPDKSTWTGRPRQQLCHPNTFILCQPSVCPPCLPGDFTTASHHRSINLRSLRERKGDTCKSQRLTELPEARKRQPSNLTSQRSPPCWPRGPAYTAYSQDGRRTVLLGQNWCPP